MAPGVQLRPEGGGRGTHDEDDGGIDPAMAMAVETENPDTGEIWQSRIAEDEEEDGSSIMDQKKLSSDDLQRAAAARRTTPSAPPSAAGAPVPPPLPPLKD